MRISQFFDEYLERENKIIEKYLSERIDDVGEADQFGYLMVTLN